MLISTLVSDIHKNRLLICSQKGQRSSILLHLLLWSPNSENHNTNQRTIPTQKNTNSKNLREAAATSLTDTPSTISRALSLSCLTMQSRSKQVDLFMSLLSLCLLPSRMPKLPRSSLSNLRLKLEMHLYPPALLRRKARSL